MRRCTRVRDLLGSYIEGDVTARERRFVECHLAECEDCAVGYQAGRGLLDRLPSDVAVSLPEEAKARILRGVRVRQRELAARRPSFLFGRTARGLVFAATVCGAAAIAIWLTLPPPLAHPDGAGTPPGTVGETSLPTPPAPSAVTPPPAPAPSVTVVAPAPSVSSQPAMGLRGASSNRHLHRGRRPAKVTDKKKAEEEKKTEAATPESQEPAKEVVAPTPAGPDDATVVTPSDK